MNAAPNLEIVWAGWLDALRRGDLETIRAHLDPEVRWQGITDDRVCRDRDEVLEWARDAVAGGLPEVQGLELLQVDERVVLGVRAPGIGEGTGEMYTGG
ncbi:MAG: nuclear transport factor 2 family protein [Actinomycetota bacterium]|nr:nuclear transport factor 2 family protein [Actinomycetota bacterium]